MHLNERWIQAVVNLPETGMGYHRVDVHLWSGRIIKNVTVLNGEELLVPLELTISESDIKNITISDNL